MCPMAGKLIRILIENSTTKEMPSIVSIKAPLKEHSVVKRMVLGQGWDELDHFMPLNREAAIRYRTSEKDGIE